MLVSTKVTKVKNSETKPTMAMDRDQYPYGLRITLNKDILGKLGLTAKDFTSGESVSIEGLCSVTETSDRTSIESGDNMSVSLQITKLGVSKTKKAGKDVATPRGK